MPEEKSDKEKLEIAYSEAMRAKAYRDFQKGLNTQLSLSKKHLEVISDSINISGTIIQTAKNRMKRDDIESAMKNMDELKNQLNRIDIEVSVIKKIYPDNPDKTYAVLESSLKNIKWTLGILLPIYGVLLTLIIVYLLNSK